MSLSSSDPHEVGAISDRTLPWTMLIPVKSTLVGKSRLAVPSPRRIAIARAMALDTVTAVAAAEAVGRIVVIVDDAADGEALRVDDAVEVHLSPVEGLNQAIAEARDAVAPGGAAGGVGPAGPVGVLPADLPSLVAAELDRALHLAGRHHTAVVPDRQGTGTTLLAARRAAMLRPRYGPQSFAAHRIGGASALTIPPESGLRCDVDSVVDLVGVTGPHTRRAAAELTRPRSADTAAG